MNPTDYIAPEDQTDFAPEESDIVNGIRRAHATPAATFRGSPLWNLSTNTHFWYLQTLDPDDLISFRDLGFVWCHVKRGGAKAADDFASIMPWLTNKSSLRIALGEWLEELTGGDFAQMDAIYAEAKTVREAAYGLVRKTEVSARDPDGPSSSLGASGAAPQTSPASSPNSLPQSTGSTPTIPSGN